MAFTFFFRDRQSLELLSREVVPAVRGYRRIDIWDAGCAHGPEPYSLAIMLREEMSEMLFRNVRIFCTDIDTCDQFGRIITSGVYPEVEIDRIPSELRRRYFRGADQPGHYELIDEIKGSLTFIKHDLLTLEPVRTGLSLIVCKNVLLHFTQRQAEDVILMFHSALREGGFLVTEQTQKLSTKTERLFQRISSDAQVFRKLETCAEEAVGIH